jgi:hypothetical protein
MNATPNRSRPGRRPRFRQPAAGTRRREHPVQHDPAHAPDPRSAAVPVALRRRRTGPAAGGGGGPRVTQSPMVGDGRADRALGIPRIPYLLSQRRPPGHGARRRPRRLRRLPDRQPRRRGAHVPARPQATLRTVIWGDQHGDTPFTVDQPSKQFASFDIPEQGEVGIELDHKLAALLDALAVAVPPELKE